MPLQCNIDSRGAQLRRIWGIAGLFMAIALAAAAVLSAYWWLWVPAVVCLLGGAFAIFEARKKWCVLRAAGVKTPL